LDLNNQAIDSKILDIDKLKDGDYEFKMFLQNADNGESTFFSLKEEDGVWGDDSIGGFDGTFDNNNLIASWIPTMYDMIAAGEEDNPEFYFEVQGDASNGLIFSFQGDGGDIDFPSCNDNTMNGDEEGVDCGGSCYEYYGEEKTCPPTVCDGVATCGNYGTEGDCTRNECLDLEEGATCSWNESSEECNEVKSYFFGDFEIGQCIYDEDTSGDNCDDGFLSYDINANWVWGGEGGSNAYTTRTACENAVGGECIQGVDNLWHYDPEGVNKECISMNSVIPCPAQIELSFFNWKNFFAAALLILIIYVILRNSKTLKKMEEKHKSPVKSSKKSSKKKVSKKKSPTKKKSTKKKSSKKKSSKKK
jgi:hypothetical protein